MTKMTREQLVRIHDAVWIDEKEVDFDAVNAVRDLLKHIDALEAELAEYRKPVQEVVTLNMATVHRLLTAAGWICYDDGHRFNRGLERMTITFTNGIFRWAWKDGQRVTVFNDLLRVGE